MQQQPSLKPGKYLTWRAKTGINKPSGVTCLPRTSNTSNQTKLFIKIDTGRSHGMTIKHYEEKLIYEKSNRPILNRTKTRVTYRTADLDIQTRLTFHL